MYQIPVVIEHDEDGYYAYSPALEGCQSQGDSLEEVRQNIHEAIELYISTLSPQEKQEVLGRQVTAIVMEVQVA